MELNKEKAIKELGIPEELYGELLAIFIEQAEEALSKLKEVINAGNFAEIVRTAHLIKGSAGHMRLEEISAVAKGIEDNASTGKDINFIKDSGRKLEELFSEFKKLV